MTKSSLSTAASWVPDACTLPTSDQPLRLAEFEELFASAVVSVEQVDDRHARLELRPQPEVAARAANLVVRETQCCSFFEFAVLATGGRLTLTAAVPAGQEAVLAALAGQATAASARVQP